MRSRCECGHRLKRLTNEPVYWTGDNVPLKKRSLHHEWQCIKCGRSYVQRVRVPVKE